MDILSLLGTSPTWYKKHNQQQYSIIVNKVTTVGYYHAYYNFKAKYKEIRIIEDN